ncbi:hypothetical protein ACFRAR_15790 [Kitasatospora sp. NPDC056651]|uniref:hypothetical protein n=1 Tax=Kitasatospora sp. NPDC056651 TaxID=3345892 RepID=UPI0036B35616
MHEAGERACREYSSRRVPVEHALADHKRWKGLARWTHRRDPLPATYLAVAGLDLDTVEDLFGANGDGTQAS